MLQKLLSPSSVAVIGASEDIQKPGGRIVRNLLIKNYAGRLFLVNPKASEIQGVAAYRSLRDLPEVPDLAFIAIPSKFVRAAFTELAAMGVKNVVVLSAGFGEVSVEGKEEEKLLAKIADENGMLILGPNCLGVMSPSIAGKFAGLLPDMREGGVDFISGSGATIDYLIEQAVKRGLAFHNFITVGNSAQTGVTDILALYEAQTQPLSKLIMLYFENIGNPSRLLRSARSLAAKGCILMAIKSGVTEAGRRAAAGHTGAMATSDVAVQALLDKAGIIRVHSRLEMIDAAMAAALARGKYDGKRACIITDAGGSGVISADELNRQGFVVPALKPETRKILAEILPPGAGTANPIDCLPSRNGEQMAAIIETLNSHEADAIDYIIFVLGDSGLSDNWEIYQEIIKAMNNRPIPIFPSFCTAISSQRPLELFREAGKCYFEDEISLARALGRMVNRPKISDPPPNLPGYDGKKLRTLLLSASGAAPVKLVSEVMKAAGIPTPAQEELRDIGGLGDLPERIGFPWVMKVTGPLHKTDVGGVIVGVQDMEQAEVAWRKLMSLENACGVLVQPMVSGPEVMLGLSREADFGHLVAAGLGGIYAEALGDMQFALAPLSHEEAQRMISSIKGLSILKGVRGLAGMDLELLGDLLVRVSLMARDVPEIQEMDINPVKGVGKDLMAVDVRIIMP